MDPAPTVDFALSGTDLSGVEPPDIGRMDGLRRRAVVAAGLLLIYPVFAGAMLLGSFRGVVNVTSDLMVVLELLVTIPGWVAFLYWFAGAYRLAQDLSPYSLQSTPGWSVAVFFIPIVNFWMPYQRMREVEDVNVLADGGGIDLDRTGHSHILAIWWAASVFSMVIGVVTGWGEGIEGPTFSGWLIMVAAMVLSSVLHALVSLHVSDGQTALAEAVWNQQPLAPEAHR